MVTGGFERGDVRYCEFPDPIKSRPALVVSRTDVNDLRDNIVVALITRTRRNIPFEVPAGEEEGLPRECVISVSDLYTISKGKTGKRLGALSEDKWRRVETALKRLFGLS